MAEEFTKTLLLVEDEAILALAEAKLLGKNGFKVLTSYTGQDAIKAIRTNPAIDLVLMDIDLGSGLDGTEAAETILRERNLPLLFLSSHTEPEIVAKTEKITSSGYVVKNSGETVLLASIRMAFKLHAAYQQNLGTIAVLQNTNVKLEEAQSELEELFREQKQAAASLKESEAAFRSLFEASPSAAVMLVDRVFRKVNSMMTTMTGYSEEELLGQSARILYVDDEEFKRAGKDLYGSLERSGIGTTQTRFRRKDGEMIDVFIRTKPLFPDEEKPPRSYSSTALDVTQWKRTQELYKTIIQTAMDAFAIYDEAARIIDVNDAFCEMFGYARAELLGMRLADIEALESPEDIAARFREVARTGAECFETRIRKKSGQELPVEVSINRAKEIGSYYFAFIRDRSKTR